MAVKIPKIQEARILKVGQPPRLNENIKKIKGIGNTPKKGIA